MVTVSNSKDIGALVRRTRKAQGLTQEQLAGVAGVGIRFLRELETGKDSCQLGRSLVVLAALGLGVAVTSRDEGAG